MASIEEHLNLLASSIDKLGIRSFFNSPASMAQIKDLKDFTKLALPAEFVAFYLKYNGGFFANERWAEVNLLDKSEFDFIQWNSNHFLAIEKIQEQFSYVEEVSNLTNEIQTECYLPFFQTEEQELYLLRFSERDPNTPVIKLIRDNPPEYWTEISKNFSDFLKDFIYKKGDIID